jgi:hypothetical protein
MKYCYKGESEWNDGRREGHDDYDRKQTRRREEERSNAIARKGG